MIYIPIRAHLADLPKRHILTQTYYDIINASIFFIIMMIYNTKFDDNFIRKRIKIFKITVIIAAIVSIVQVVNTNFLNPRNYYEYEDYSFSLYEFRRTSIFGFVNPNEIGLSYMPLLSVLIGYSLFKKNNKYIFFLLLGGISAFLSNGRYVMVAFVILTLQLILSYKVKTFSIFRYLIFTSIAIIILFYTLTSLGYDVSNWYNVRLFPEGSMQEITRYKAIDNFLIFFPRTIFFGTGVHLTDEIRAASHVIGSSQIHVGYLSHLVSYGIVGSFFLFGFWFLLAKKLYKTAKQTNYWGSFFAFLTFFWAQATLVYYSIFFYGLIFALVFDKYFQDKHNEMVNDLYQEKKYNST